MTFDKIKSTTFDELQVEAGVLLSDFNPASPAVVDNKIIAATTGGISINCQPQTSDWGSDIDNCPNNTKELLHIDGWTCTISTTILSTTLDAVKLALGAWVAGDNGKIKPTKSLDSDTHFTDVWFVGDRSDGGSIAIHLLNAFSSGGFQLKTNKNGKGTISLELTGYVSIDSPSDYPMEFYVSAGTSGTTGTSGNTT